jgi:hypothetical protein
VSGENEVLSVGGTLLRTIPCPAHSPESLAYYLNDSHALIVDEGFGYYNGREPGAPGADYSITALEKSLECIKDLELQYLALPFGGVLSGSLVRKHLTSVVQNCKEIMEECAAARSEGVPHPEIIEAVKKHFYSFEVQDALFLGCLERSISALEKQFLANAG